MNLNAILRGRNRNNKKTRSGKQPPESHRHMLSIRDNSTPAAAGDNDD